MSIDAIERIVTPIVGWGVIYGIIYALREKKESGKS